MAFGAAAGAYALSSLIVPAGAAAQSLPQGGSVAAGSAQIVQPSADTLEVRQTSNRAIVNWDSFNVGAGHTVNFQQPSAASATLNRVTGGDPSAILGAINAPGTVMLVNPNGVFFGPGSRVDVGSLVATTANVRDADFMAGTYAFDQASANREAMVVNAGEISIKDTGLAALVAPGVENSGVIRARLGRVALGGVETFSLDFHGDGLLSFRAGAAVQAQPRRPDGSLADALVTNTGTLAAEGGVIELTARAVKGVVDNVINTSGVAVATSVSTVNGRIVLSGGDAGTVALGGSLDASGRAAGGTGGSIVATGATVAVAGDARLDASGDAGGGRIAVGSDGTADGVWSPRVSVAAGATLVADAIDRGDGGDVTVLSEHRTDFAGRISARGGANGGDGGFAEVSSRDDITLTGQVDLSAPHGATGTFLLDPDTLRIVAGAGGSQNAAAADGSIVAGDANQGSGDNTNTVSADTLAAIAGNSNIVLQATGLITVDAPVNLQTGNGNSFTLESTQSGGIVFTRASDAITTQGGAIRLIATGGGATLTNIGQLNSNGGAITLIAASAVEIAGNLNAGAGAITVESIAGSIGIAGGTTPKLTGGTVSLSAATGNVGAAGAAISTSTAGLTLRTGGNLFAASDTTLTSLAVTANHVVPNATNTYQVTAPGLTFDVADGASSFALNNVVGGGAFSFTGDRGLALGTVNAGGSAVALTSTGGSITGTGGTLVTGSALTATAAGTTGANGGVGTAGQSILTAVGSLTVDTGSGGVHVSNTGALTLANVDSNGASNTVAATGTITVGTVAAVPSGGTGTISLQSTGGSILDDENLATRLTAGTLTLQATGAIGLFDAPIATTATSVTSASAGSGGVFLDFAGTASLTQVTSTDGAVRITTVGSATVGNLVSSNGTSNVFITANQQTDVAAGVTPSDAVINVGTLNAGAGGNVTLTTTSGNIQSTGGTVTANLLTANAGGTASRVQLTSAAQAIAASSGTGGIAITQNGAVTLNSLTTTGSSITVASSAGNVTYGTVRTNGAQGSSVSLAASGGAILGTGDTNRITADSTTLSASGALGTSATRLRTGARVLQLTGTGDLYVDNLETLLTTLLINNKHVGSTANTLQLTSDQLVFTATDDGTRTTLSEISSPFLETLTYTSDKGLVLGQLKLAAAESTATLTAATGDILDDGNKTTRLSADTVALQATAGSLGAAAASLDLESTKVTLGTRGNLHVINLADMTKLTIGSTHVDGDAVSTFSIAAPSLQFGLTDDTTNGYALASLIDTTGLDFTFTGDRSIRLGAVDLTNAANTLKLTATAGSILDDGSSATEVLAPVIELTASAAIGASDGALDLVTGQLSAQASNGGIFIDVLRTYDESNTTNKLSLKSPGLTASGGAIRLTVATGDLDLGAAVTAHGQAVTLAATTGSISGSSTVSAGAGSISLTAGKAIGSATSAVNVSAASLSAQSGTSMWLNGSTASTLASLTAGGDVTYTQSSGTTTVGTISANAGTGTVKLTNTTSGGINGDADAATVIAAGRVELTATSGSVGGSNAINLTAPSVQVSNSGTIALTNTVAYTSLALLRTSSSTGSISISSVDGQSLAIADGSGTATLTSLASSTALDFTYSNAKSIQIGTIAVTAAGKATIDSTGGSLTKSGGSSNVTAGEVTLKAGTGSVGTSVSAIAVSTAKLNVTARTNTHVASSAALTHLAVTNTNSNTASLSNFAISGTGGPAISITDSGTTQTVDVSGANITDFSFTNSKNIKVSEIVASGAVALATSGGGANSNITSVSQFGQISGGSVSLSASGTGTGNGSIGTSETNLAISTPSLTVVSNGDIYVNNGATALTTLNVTSTHKDANAATTNSYAFNSIGTGRSFSVADAAGVQTLALSSGAGTMDFTYSTDRAIATGSIDAGTSTTGAVRLTSTGGTSAGGVVAGTINRSSGTITGGLVELTALATNSGIGNSATLSTNTKRLAIASGGDVSVSNSTSLTDLTLDAQHRKSPSGANTYAISSSGLTFSVGDSTGTTGLTLTSIAQSGLNLTVKADKTISVTSVNVGAGTLAIDAKGGDSAIQATTGGSTVLTAAELTLTASSVGVTNSTSPLKSNVDTLAGTIKSSLRISNDGTLTLKGIAFTGDSGTATLEVTNDGSLLQSGTAPLAAHTVNLTVANGDIGDAGTPLLLDTRVLSVSSGQSVRLSNASDLHSLTLNASHGTPVQQNTYEIASDRLAFSLTDTSSGDGFTLSNLVDQSGLDFSFTGDVRTALGTVNAQPGRTLAVTSTSGDITSNGASQLTAGKITLTAAGQIGVGTNATTRIQTSTRDLTLVTAASAFVDNGLDLTRLSITGNASGATPSYAITAPGLTFNVSDDGRTNLTEITDTTGLDLTFSTARGQSVGVVNTGSVGSVALTSAGGILGALNAQAATQRLTAGKVTLTATGGSAIGSATNGIHLSASQLTVNDTGNVFVDSDTHLDELKFTSTHTGATPRTYSFTSVDRNGNGGGFVFAAGDDGNGATITTLTDTTGLDFTYSNDKDITVGTLDVGARGTVTLNATGNGAIKDDLDGGGTTRIRAAQATLSATNGKIGDTGGNAAIDIEAGSVSATTNGAGVYLALHGTTMLGSISAQGPVVLSNDLGDIALGSITANGSTVAINNTGGSILSGSINAASSVSLAAAGSIGSVTAIGTTGTTFSSVTAAANGRGATGSVAITSSTNLTVTALTAASDTTLSANSALQVGTINAGAGVVSLTATNGALTGSDGDNLTTGSRVTLSARSGAVGADGTPVRVSTTDLTVNSASSIFVTSLLDLANLSIDRTPQSGASTSGTLSLAATNLTWDVTDGASTTFTNVVDSTGLNLSYKALDSIVVGTLNVGSGTVVLQALPTTGSSSITAVNGSSKLTAGALTLLTTGAESAIGSSGTRLGLNVASLKATAGTGGLFVRNDVGLDLKSLTSNGALSVTADTGDLAVGALTWGSSSALSLAATAGKLTAGTGTLTAGSSSASISLTAGTGIGTAAAPIRISAFNSGGTGSTVAATVTGTGSAFLDFAGGVQGGLTTSVNNGATTVFANGNMKLTSMSATDGVGDDITVTTTSGNITVGDTTGATGVNAGANNGRVTLTAAAGQILAGNADSSLGGFEVNLTAASGVGTAGQEVGAGGKRVQVRVTSTGAAAHLKSATSGTFALVGTNGGAINITGSNGASLLLGNLVSGGGAATAGAITVGTAGDGGNLLVGNVDATGTTTSGAIVLTATDGSILDDGIAATRLTGASLALAAGTGVGTDANPLQTRVPLITGGVTGAGSLFIADDRSAGIQLGTAGTALTVANGALRVAAAGPVAVTNVTSQTDGAGKDATVTSSSGDITVTSLFAGATAATDTPTQSAARLTASAGSILGSATGPNVVAGKLAATASANIGAVTDVTTGAGTPLAVKVAGIELLSATTAGSLVSVDNSGAAALSLGGGAVALGANSSAYIRTGGDLDASAGLALGNGNLLLRSGGTLTLPTAGISTTGALNFTGITDVVANGGGRTLTMAGSTVTFASGSAGGATTLATTTSTLNASLTAADTNLTVNNTGNLTSATLAANGNVAATGSTGITGTSVVASGGGGNRTVTLTATSGNVTAGTVNAGAAGTVNLNAPSGTVAMGVGGGGVTANTLGIVTLNGIGSQATPFQANVTTINGQVTGTGDIVLSYAGGATLGTLGTANGNIAVTAAGALVANPGTITAAGNLSLTSTGGGVTVTGDYVNAAAGTNRGLTASGTTVSLQGVTTSGAQSYTGATTLGGNLGGSSIQVTGGATLAGGNRTLTTANGALGISGTLQGAGNAIVLNAGSGTVTLGGMALNLASMTATGGTINLSDVTTTGAQTYNGATRFNSTYTTAGGSFTVNGGLVLNGDSTINSNGGAVTVTGAIDGGRQLVVNAQAGDVTFSGTATGAQRLGALAVNSSGRTALSGRLAAASVATDAAGTLSVGGTVDTTGMQQFGERMDLSSDATLNGTSVTLSGGAQATAAGGQSLTVNGALTSAGGIGDATALGTLAVSGATTLATTGAATVATTGAQTYAGTLAGGTRAVTLNAGGGAVSIGGAASMASLSVTGASIGLSDVTTAGAQTYVGATRFNSTYTTGGGAFSVTGATTLGSDTTVATAGGAVAFGGSIDGARALTVAAGAGNVTFGGDVGTATRLGALVVDSSGETSFAGRVVAASLATDAPGTFRMTGSAIDTTGAQAIGERLDIGAALTLTGSTITVASGIDGAHALTVNGGLVAGSIGGSAPLGSLTVNGPATLNGPVVRTQGDQTFNGATTLGQDTVFTGRSVALLGGGAMAGRAVSVTGDAVFAGTFGGNGALGALTVSGSTGLRGGSIATTGNQSYGGAVSLSGGQTLTSTGGTLTFGGTIDSTNASDLTLNTGDVTNGFTAAIGASGPLGLLTINTGAAGATTFAAGAGIRTTSGLVHTGGLTLRLPANVTVSDGPIRLGTVQAGQSLQRIDGAIVSLPDGAVSIAAAGDVTMAGLSGLASDLTLRAGSGRIRIGSQDGGGFLPDPARKIAVRSLTVPQAGSASLYGSVAGQFGPAAAYIVGPLAGAPYFINDTPWGPPPATMMALPPAINPPPPPAPPSTPQADALFNLQADPAGINPDALAPFTPPNVLQVGAAPVTLTTPPSGAAGTGATPAGTSDGATGGTGEGGAPAAADDDDDAN